MFKQKPKSYQVVLDAEVGGCSTMLVIGCIDEEECIKFAMKAKQKHQCIKELKEITARMLYAS
ncbi:MAG: hypothetical protein ACO24P_03695 [Candidatus Nanopelagicaceae bacterium]